MCCFIGFDIKKILVTKGGTSSIRTLKPNIVKYKKCGSKIRACGENALVKSFKMSPHMIYVLKGPLSLYCGL